MRRIFYGARNENENEYVTNKRMLFHFTVCFSHRIKPGSSFDYYESVIFFVSLSFSKPPSQILFYFTYPLAAHWMAAVVLLLIQGKLTDENNGKKYQVDLMLTL